MSSILRTYRCEDCGGVIEWTGELPGHSSLVRFVQEDNLFKQIEVILKDKKT